MKRFMTILSIVVLLVSLFLLFDRIFKPQPIQIVLESGQEVTTQNSEYFSLTEAILLVVCSFLIGSTSIYLFYNADRTIFIKSANQDKTNKYEHILPLLKEDERKLFLALKEANGEMLQNKLVIKLNMSKVKVTRLIYRLERKNLIVKERYGLTNKIKLKN